jgi:hypothetical protein
MALKILGALLLALFATGVAIRVFNPLPPARAASPVAGAERHRRHASRARSARAAGVIAIPGRAKNPGWSHSANDRSSWVSHSGVRYKARNTVRALGATGV